MPTYQIQVRRGTAAEWTAANAVLAGGEFGYETDSKRLKVGDGTAAWADLAYLSPGPNSVVASSGISSLTSGQQTSIVVGTLVTTSDGRRWIYSGTGSKTAEGSYVELADVTPAWSTIVSTPTTLAGYGITDAVGSSDSRLTNQRVPTDGSVTDAKIDSAGLSTSVLNWAAITEWAASTAYAKGALVSYLGVGYRRVSAGTTGATFNSANWQQITPTVNVVATASSITSDQNDYALPAATDIVRLSASAARIITGVVAGVGGQAELLINVGSFAITLRHQNAGSAAANRLIVPWAGDYVLDANGGAALLVYDATDSRWRVV